MTKPNIAVIGLGKLGGRLSEEIIRNTQPPKLFLWNRSRRRMEGMFTSLRIYSKLLGSQTQVDTFKPTELRPTDVVVIAVKDNYDPRDLLADEKYPPWFPVDVRTVGFRRDLPLVRSVCTMLKGFEGNVVVITNPLDIFTTLVKRWLPKATVLGLGVSLDAARLYCRLSDQKMPLESWHDCPLAGEHGKRLVVVESLWKNTPRELGLTPKELAAILSEAMKTGPRIVAGLGYTLHDCVLVFAQDVQWIHGHTTRRKWLHASYGDPEGATGRPLVLDPATRRIRPVADLPPIESSQISNARESCASLVQKILKHQPFQEYIHLD